MSLPDLTTPDLEIVITIGVDGRLYCQDMPPQVVAVLRALCPLDPELAKRQVACSHVRDASHE